MGKALDQLLILHADHEQNCSDFDGASGRVEPRQLVRVGLGWDQRAVRAAAWWAPNQAVLDMLERIKADGGDVDDFVAQGQVQGGRGQA